MTHNESFFKTTCFGLLPTKHRVLEKTLKQLRPLGFELWCRDAMAAAEWGRDQQALLFSKDGREVRLLRVSKREKSGIISDSSFSVDEVDAVNFEVQPRELNEAMRQQDHSYTLGGALVGGVGGFLIGSMIDGIRGSTGRVARSVCFKLEFDFCLRDGKKLGLTSDYFDFGEGMEVGDFRYHSQVVLQGMQHNINAMKIRFGDKVIPSVETDPAVGVPLP